MQQMWEKIHKVPIVNEIVENIDKNIDLLFKKYHKIAFWGINDYFADLSRYLDTIKQDSAYYVDTSQMKKGMSICNKVIFSPEIINEEGIEAVIIPPIAFYTSIYQQIIEKHKNVKAVFSILDIVDTNFNVN